jgi:WhiB family transcriptional regulator, redox-sensing transcriptional regulator
MTPPALADKGLDWLDSGACRDEDPDLFFPIAFAGPGLAQIALAKAVCARCAVREMCLGFALETRQDHGVWGGMSEEERRTIAGARRHQATRLAD